MKLLLFFIFLSGSLACSVSAVDSEGQPIDEGQLEEEGDDESTFADQEGDTISSNPKAESLDEDEDEEENKPKSVLRTGACAKYPLSCGSNVAICGQKYEHCLAPKAGEPQATYSVMCSKEEEQTLILLVNSWNGKVGQNQLLCDFWENTSEEEILYVFATNQKNICQIELNRRKKELIKAGYNCE